MADPHTPTRRLSLPASFAKARYRTAQSIRTAWYSGQLNLLKRRSGGFNRPDEPPFEPQSPRGDEAEIRKAFFQVFRDDLANVEAGLYPAPENVRPRDLWRSLRSAMLSLNDASEVNRRRIEREGFEVRQETQASKRYPAYYLQNFHYQSGGWFTDDSARLYDTQVETLFAGSADAMRRAALAEIAREVLRSDHRDQAYLDVASGTGRFLAQVMAAYPRLSAKGLDLSPAYCAHARKALARWPRVEILESAAEAMPVESDSQDIVSCIYLFHELPPRYRKDVAAELFRVLKPGGLFVFADSTQIGDNPALDRQLEIFPEAFHEPYYKNYCTSDLNALFCGAGFNFEKQKLAFLTKVMCWRKPD